MTSTYLLNKNIRCRSLSNCKYLFLQIKYWPQCISEICLVVITNFSIKNIKYGIYLRFGSLQLFIFKI